MRLSLILFAAILALTEARRIEQSDDSSHEADARNRNHADKQLSEDVNGRKGLKENKEASAVKNHKDAQAHKKLVEGPDGYASSEFSNLDQTAANNGSQSSLELFQGPDGFSRRQSSDDSSSYSSSKKSHNSKVVVDGEGGEFGGAGYGGYSTGYGAQGQYGAGQFGGQYDSSQSGSQFGGSQSGSEYGAGQFGGQSGQYGSEAGYGQSGTGHVSGEYGAGQQEGQGGLYGPRPLPLEEEQGEHSRIHSGYQPEHPRNGEYGDGQSEEKLYGPPPFPYEEDEKDEHRPVNAGYQPEPSHHHREPHHQPLEGEYIPDPAGNDEYDHNPSENYPNQNSYASQDQIITIEIAVYPGRPVSQEDGENEAHDPKIIGNDFDFYPSFPDYQHPDSEHNLVHAENEEQENSTPRRPVSPDERNSLGQGGDDDQETPILPEGTQEFLENYPQLVPLPGNEESQYRFDVEPFRPHPAVSSTSSTTQISIVGPPTYFTTARPEIFVDSFRTTNLPQPQLNGGIGPVIIGPRLLVSAANEGQVLKDEPRIQKLPSASTKARHGGYSAANELDDSTAESKKHTHSKNELSKGPDGYKKASSLDESNQAEASKVHKKSAIRADRYGSYAKSAEESGSNSTAQNHVKANNFEKDGPNGYLKRNEVDEESASKANKFDKKSSLMRNADGSFSSNEEDDSSSASQEKSHKANSVVIFN